MVRNGLAQRCVGLPAARAQARLLQHEAASTNELVRWYKETYPTAAVGGSSKKKFGVLIKEAPLLLLCLLEQLRLLLLLLLRYPSLLFSSSPLSSLLPPPLSRALPPLLVSPPLLLPSSSSSPPLLPLLLPLILILILLFPPLLLAYPLLSSPLPPSLATHFSMPRTHAGQVLSVHLPACLSEAANCSGRRPTSQRRGQTSPGFAS